MYFLNYKRNDYYIRPYFQKNKAFYAIEGYLFPPDFQILDDEIQADFYVAVPEIMPELNPLRKKLKTRFPKFNRSKGEFFYYFSTLSTTF